jgi:protein TonB
MADPGGKFIFWRSAAISLGLHLAAVFWIVLLAPLKPEAVYQPLGVMDFMLYDPEGGEPGGEEEAAPPEPEMEEAEPEPDEPEELPAVVESAAPEAEPPPPPPPPKKNEAPPKPKPPAAEPRTAPAGNAGQAGQGRGGEGGGTGRGTRDAMRAYQSQVRRKLERNKKYPAAAQARKITGVATLGFTIHRGGAVSGVRLAKSSGHAILDDEVLALLQRAASLPPIPPEISANTLSLSVPIRFSVR